MKKFKDFINEADQFVLLDNGLGGNLFKTAKYGSGNSISNINNVIKDYISEIYGPFGFVYGDDNKDIDVSGSIINTEYISKMVNNYTVFKNVIRYNNIKDEESFYNFIENNLDDIYGYNGRFFKRETLPILINTTRKGNDNEKSSKEKFLEYSKSQGINITLQNPTIQEDISGIDSKFILGRTYTIQIKPFTDYKTISDKIYIKSNGSMSLGTNYLILYNGDNFIILRNPMIGGITIKGDVFISSRENIMLIS